MKVNFCLLEMLLQCGFKMVGSWGEPNMYALSSESILLIVVVVR